MNFRLFIFTTLLLAAGALRSQTTEPDTVALFVGAMTIEPDTVAADTAADAVVSYVSRDEYAALERENETLREALEQSRATVGRLQGANEGMRLDAERSGRNIARADTLRLAYARMVLSQPYDASSVATALNALDDIADAGLRDDNSGVADALMRFGQDNTELLEVVRGIQEDPGRTLIRGRDGFADRALRAIRSTRAFVNNAGGRVHIHPIPALTTIINMAVERLRGGLSPNPPADFTDLIRLMTP